MHLNFAGDSLDKVYLIGASKQNNSRLQVSVTWLSWIIVSIGIFIMKDVVKKRVVQNVWTPKMYNNLGQVSKLFY